MVRIRVFVLSLVAVLAASEISAQEPLTVEVQGRVIDDASGASIEGADILMMDAFGNRMARRTSDEHGRFAFPVRRVSAVQFRASRVGYREVSSPILNLEERSFFMVELRMDVDIVLLAPLEVVVRSEVHRSAVLSGFDHRITRGMGRYFSRDQIEGLRPSRVTDLLATLPGVRIDGGGGRGFQRTIVMARSQAAGRACNPQIFLDGRLMNRGGEPLSPDDLVSPEDLEGVEVYAGMSTVPAEFLNPDSRCGVVALWTRRSDQ